MLYWYSVFGVKLNAQINDINFLVKERKRAVYFNQPVNVCVCEQEQMILRYEITFVLLLIFCEIWLYARENQGKKKVNLREVLLESKRILENMVIQYRNVTKTPAGI